MSKIKDQTMSSKVSWESTIGLLDSVKVDEVGVKERVSSLSTRSIKRESKLQALNYVVSMCDLTTLEGEDTEGKIHQMTAKAIRSKFSTKSLHYQPELFSLKCCLELKTVDSIFWFSSFCDSLPDENVLNYPFVAIGPESMGKKYSKFFKENKNSIFIPIATPGAVSYTHLTLPTTPYV